MIKRFPVLLIVLALISSFAFAQSSSYKKVKAKVAPIAFTENPNAASNFYIDYKNRQLNSSNKPNGATQDLVYANFDWPSNSWTPASTFMYDFTGDGALDPFAFATDQDQQRAGVFGFIDDFGQSQYFLYGLTGTGIPVRTGWDSHLIMGENGVVYVSIYDFLNSNGLINNHLWEIDLMNDPGTGVELTDSLTALNAGWPRMALDGNGIFWELADNYVPNYLNIAASTDGGHTFSVIDSIGSNDPTFWGTAFGNDPVINAHGDKISVVTSVAKAGGLGAVYGGGDTQDPDSASGLYHWYSTDGGGTWQGTMIQHDGSGEITNRPTYEIYFEQFDIGSQYVDMQGVTHVVHGGTNSVGIRSAYHDTSNVYPIAYWNDRDKNWISVELPAVEQYDYSLDGSYFVGNMNGPQRPFVKTDSTGQLVVVMWARPQFSGEPGASSINVYSDATEGNWFYYDIVYAYSEDGGVTFHDPEIAYSVPDEENYWPQISEVETQGDVATVHFISYYDEIPGTSVLGESSKSVGIWKYNTVSFNFTPVGVKDNNLTVDKFSLDQNYPNPFNPTTTINYTLSKRSNVELKVYNTLGQEVITLVNGEQEVGAHSIDFNASNLASGLYIYKIQAGNFTQSKKMMLLK